GMLAGERAGVHARGGDREQLRTDVDGAPEERLALLQASLPARDPVKDRARELARASLDESQVLRERAELVVRAGALTLADDELRQPPGVEATGPERAPGPVGELRLALQQVAGRLEVGVDGLACDQEVHDLGRALEDPVDAHV